MQQLYLTGDYATVVADRLFNALNVRPAGYRLLPVEAGGATRGEALHLLLPPAAPLHNDVPCRIRLTPAHTQVLTWTLSELAAPALTSALAVHAPMLLGGLYADMLDTAAFRTAVTQCLQSPRPVIAVVDEGAEAIVRSLTEPEHQLWVHATADNADALLEQLLPEAIMRF